MCELFFNEAFFFFKFRLNGDRKPRFLFPYILIKQRLISEVVLLRASNTLSFNCYSNLEHMRIHNLLKEL